MKSATMKVNNNKGMSAEVPNVALRHKYMHTHECVINFSQIGTKHTSIHTHTNAFLYLKFFKNCIWKKKYLGFDCCWDFSLSARRDWFPNISLDRFGTRAYNGHNERRKRWCDGENECHACVYFLFKSPIKRTFIILA